MVRFVETKPRRGILQSGAFYMLLLALQVSSPCLQQQQQEQKDQSRQGGIGVLKLGAELCCGSCDDADALCPP